MRPFVLIPAAALLCLRAGVAFGDSSPPVPPEPAEVRPVEISAQPAEAPAPVPAPAPESRRAKATPIEAVVVSAPAASAEPARRSAFAGRNGSELALNNKAVPVKIARQYHSSYYVNRVKLKLPAGIRVTVRKDWYTDEVILVYAANPYTNWRGVTPDAFVFRHPGTSLEVLASGTKYMPTELTVYVPSAIQVEVN